MKNIAKIEQNHSKSLKCYCYGFYVFFYDCYMIFSCDFYHLSSCYYSNHHQSIVFNNKVLHFLDLHFLFYVKSCFTG